MNMNWKIVCLAVLLFAACGEEAQPPEPVVRPVRYAPVYVTGGERVRQFAGTARAGVESRLSFKVAGTVSRVPVNVGDGVEVGDLIAELDAKDYKLQVQEAEAGLKSGQAQARNAEASFARVQQLYEDGNASRADLDAARAGAESAREQVNSGGKRLELAKSQLSYTQLRAPLDGSIAAVRVEANENVSPGQAVVLLTSGSQLDVEIAVPEVLISEVREGQAVNVRFDALKDEVLSGRVTEVGVSSTGMATTFPVIVRLDRGDQAVRPGMAADVELSFGQSGGREHLYVPAVSVAEDRQGRYVYVVVPMEEGFGQVGRRAVGVGELSSTGLEILDGLKDGELVVTAGVSRIVDGQKVRLLGAN